MQATLAYIVARLKEPSSYAGIAALLAFVGIKITPEGWQTALTIITALSGALAVIIPAKS
jgi:hypothetical protein